MNLVQIKGRGKEGRRDGGKEGWRKGGCREGEKERVSDASLEPAQIKNRDVYEEEKRKETYFYKNIFLCGSKDLNSFSDVV